MYKQIYNNIIKKQDELIDRTKKMIEADKVIKTDYIHPQTQYTENQKKILKYLRNKLGA